MLRRVWFFRFALSLALLLPFLGCTSFGPIVPPVWSIIPLSLQEETLAVGQQKEWTFDQADGDIFLLFMEARTDWESLAGNHYGMELVVNGRTVTGEYVINKPEQFTFADGRAYPYYRKQGTFSPAAYWSLFYSPDFESNNVRGSQYQVLDGQAYLYVFDITPLVKRGERNTVVMRNRGEEVQDYLKRPVPLHVRQVRVLRKL